MKLFEKAERENPIPKSQKALPLVSTERKLDIDSIINQASSKRTIQDTPSIQVPLAEEKTPPIETQLQESTDPPPPPSTIENDWAEQKMAEELQEIKETEALLPSSQEPTAETASKPRKKERAWGGRTKSRPD